MKKYVVRFKKEDFITEVKGYKRLAISLGEVEFYFLGLFSLHKTLTAYQIFLHLEKTGKPMGYPNVRKRVKRLEELRLIKFKRYFKRKAIEYTLTHRGLFERLLMPRSVYYAVHPTIWYDWRDNIILQALLYQHFEIYTIWKFLEVVSSTISVLVDDYLRKCCEAILTKLEQIHKSDDLQLEIDKVIKDELKDLILRVISISNMENQRRDMTPKSKFIPYLPYATLKKDGKFMTLLKETKSDFDNGIKYFI